MLELRKYLLEMLLNGKIYYTYIVEEIYWYAYTKKKKKITKFCCIYSFQCGNSMTMGAVGRSGLSHTDTYVFHYVLLNSFTITIFQIDMI